MPRNIKQSRQQQLAVTGQVAQLVMGDVVQQHHHVCPMLMLLLAGWPQGQGRGACGPARRCRPRGWRKP